MKRKNYFKKIISAMTVTLVLLFCGNVRQAVIPASLNAKKVLFETFTVLELSGRQQATDILTDFLALAMTSDGKSEVFNSTKGAEDEKSPENVIPQSRIEEKTIKYENSKAFVDWNSVLIKNHTNKSIDLYSYMKDYNPVKKKSEPQILIVHTHGTEGYADQPTSRTQDTSKNVVAVGDTLTEELTKRGFSVLHDRKMHDLPSYNGSYKNCLKTLEWYKEHYGDKIDIVFDIHRDAFENQGAKVKVACDVNGKKGAQLMFVVGTDQGGLKHENWQENLKFASGLQSKINSLYPDLMRPIDLRVERFNQHITKNAFIIEVGSNGNTLDEAKYSMTLLADALDKYITK